LADRGSITGGSAIGGINLLLRFLLELAMVAALAVFAWGTLIAPRAPARLDDPARLAVEVALFGLAATAMIVAGLPIWSVALSVIAAVNIAILQALRLR
jgi:hypothetical protein